MLLRLFFVWTLLTAANETQPTNYYVSPLGNDDAAGTSETNAWHSLARVNQQQLRPGDQILLAGGAVFEGTLRIDSLDYGSEGAPVIVTSYGEGRAVILAPVDDAIRVDQTRWIRIENIEVRGHGRFRNQQGNGIAVRNSKDVVIRGVESSGFEGAGLLVRGASDRLELRNVNTHDNGSAGIEIRCYPKVCRDIYVGYSRAYNNPGNPNQKNRLSGNGIVMAGVSGGMIEYSVASWNGWDMPIKNNGPVGIWCWSSEDIVIQHNISHHNRSAEIDGGGFDLDGGVRNSVMQYNYSYENGGAGFLLYTFGASWEMFPWGGNVVRYNVSRDDALTNHRSGIAAFVDSGAVIYGNTVLARPGHDGVDGCNACPRYNNLILGDSLGGRDANGNLFAIREHGSFSGLSVPLNDHLDPDPTRLSEMNPFLPHEGYSIVDKGIDLKALGLHPERDLWGTEVPMLTGFDIGAYEHPGGEITD